MEIKLLKLIMNNDDKWNIICRINNKRFTAEEAKELLAEMKEMSASEEFSNNGFDTVTMIIINQYFCELFPDA